MFGLSIAETILLGIILAIVVFAVRSRRKKTYYGQTLGDVTSPFEVESDCEPETETQERSDEPEKMSVGKRLYGIGFLVVWLSGWTLGCVLAIRERLNMSYGDEGYIFLTLWLAFAIPAWFFAAWTLVRLLRGDEVDFDTHDD